jgi:copper transport protein
VLDASPPSVVLHFGENVEITPAAIKLYDGRGGLISTSGAHHPNGDGSRVAVSVPTLAKGAFIVAWRVVSADSHPVHGAFSFQVGKGSGAADQALVNRLLAADGGDPVVGAVLAVLRFLAFAAMAVTVGALAFSSFIWPAGMIDERGRRLLLVSAAIGAGASVAAIGVQVPYGLGRSLGGVFNASGWRDVLDTRTGRTWALRALLSAAIALHALVAPLGRRIVRAVLLVLGAGILAAATFSGHGGTGRWPAVGVAGTFVHLAAMATWLGGLVVLAVVVLGRGDATPDEAEAATAHFSRVAFAAVVVVVASGLAQAWRQVGSIGALDTTYGHLLIAKTVAVAAMVGLGGLSRRVLAHRASTEATTTSTVRRNVRIEVAVGAVVLAITSILVASQPAIAARSTPFDATIVQGKRFASITIDPARRGRNTIHVTIASTGGALEKADQITVQATLPAQDLGPLEPPLTPLGANHVTSDNLQLPFAGVWRVDVLARYGEFTEVTFSTQVTVH